MCINKILWCVLKITNKQQQQKQNINKHTTSPMSIYLCVSRRSRVKYLKKKLTELNEIMKMREREWERKICGIECDQRNKAGILSWGTVSGLSTMRLNECVTHTQSLTTAFSH